MSSIDALRLICFQQDLAQSGNLTVFPGATAGGVPFAIARIFTIAGVPAGGSRGNHAHRACHQLLVCVEGVLEVGIDDGTRATTILLAANGQGLLVPPMLWNTVRFTRPGTVLMVLCDLPYEADEYIRNRREYLCFQGIAGPGDMG